MYLRGAGKIVLVVAMSGIAALLLDGGRTVHSRFKLPVPLPLEGAVANISASSGLAQLLRNTDLLIWDEAPNAPRPAFDTVDRCLRDLLGDLPSRSNNLPFGGLPVLLGGDFRQIPPVLHRVGADAIASFTLRSCSFWENDRHVKKFELTRNKRAAGDEHYAAFLLQIGNGTYSSPEGFQDAVLATSDTTPYHPSLVTLPSNMLLPLDADEHTLIEWVFESHHKECVTSEIDSRARLLCLANRCIVTPTNEAAIRLNHLMLADMPGDDIVVYSTDIITDESASPENYPLEFLHTIETASLPPHDLRLKIGCVLMVLRNYAPHLGVCNGTRVELLEIGRRIMKVRILTGPRQGDEVHLPRICCDSTCDNDLPFAFRRYQFPVKLAWAITINKSQGQGFTGRVGLYLPKPVFAHGQLYVALSRAASEANVKILAGTYVEQQFFVVDSSNIRYLKTLNIVDARILGRATLASTKANETQTLTTNQKNAEPNAPIRQRRRLRGKTSLQLWEEAVAVESIPVLPAEANVPSENSEKYDADLDVVDVPESTQDVLADKRHDEKPLDKENFDDSMQDVSETRNWVISKDLCRENASFRLRAKRGDIDVYHDADDTL